jgi:1A family penicillin-binding protein
MYVPSINYRRVLKKLFRYFLSAAFVVPVAGLLALVIINRSLPDISNAAIIGPVSSKIFDRNGVLLYEIHGETKRTPVELAEISPFLKDATVAIEDRGFYNHSGVSVISIARAAYENHKSGRITQGGSTITQQLVKLSLLTNERTYERKIKEAILSMRLEGRHSKEEILEMYLNRIPYGRNTYGAEAASLAYLAKHAKDLTLAESAYLASLPKAPSLYSPSGANAQELEGRKDLVLSEMLSQGMISQEQHDSAAKEKVAFSRSKTELAAPHFVKWVEAKLINQYGRDFLETEGLEVYTSLDARLQGIAEKAVAEGAEINTAKYNANNAALVAIEPKTGHIVAMVGGKNYFGTPTPVGCTPGVNCAFDPATNVATSNRQPGSSFKPYTYVTAFSEQFGYSPASKILDRTQNFGTQKDPYRPVNYNNRQYGVITMRKALAGSLNVSAVRTLSMIGTAPVIKTVKDMGINTPMDSCGLSLTLGACEVKLVEHVSAFSVLANLGEKVNVTPILKITDKTGQVLYEHETNFQQVLNPQAAYEVVDIMTDNNARSFIFGKKSPLILADRRVAAKTGTSQDFKDGWTIGFTPQLAAGVWAGNNDGRLMKKQADGVFTAAPIWNKFMREAHATLNLPAEDFRQPDGIQRVKISASSGKLATQYTPDAVTEIFADYSVPKQKDTYRPAPVIVDSPYFNLGGSNESLPEGIRVPIWSEEARRQVSGRARTTP